MVEICLAAIRLHYLYASDVSYHLKDFTIHNLRPKITSTSFDWLHLLLFHLFMVCFSSLQTNSLKEARP